MSTASPQIYFPPYNPQPISTLSPTTITTSTTQTQYKVLSDPVITAVLGVGGVFVVFSLFFLFILCARIIRRRKLNQAIVAVSYKDLSMMKAHASPLAKPRWGKEDRNNRITISPYKFPDLPRPSPTRNENFDVEAYSPSKVPLQNSERFQRNSIHSIPPSNSNNEIEVVNIPLPPIEHPSQRSKRSSTISTLSHRWSTSSGNIQNTMKTPQQNSIQEIEEKSNEDPRFNSGERG